MKYFLKFIQSATTIDLVNWMKCPYHIMEKKLKKLSNPKLNLTLNQKLVKSVVDYYKFLEIIASDSFKGLEYRQTFCQN